MFAGDTRCFFKGKSWIPSCAEDDDSLIFHSRVFVKLGVVILALAGIQLLLLRLLFLGIAEKIKRGQGGVLFACIKEGGVFPV